MKTQNILMLRMRKLNHAMLVVGMSMFTTLSAVALEEVPDNELAKVTGRELATFTTINPGEIGNPNGDVGFFRLGLNAKIEINSNINKLRLGCDDPAGNNCDISIDKVALSGLVPFVSDNEGKYPQFGNVTEKLEVAKKIKSRFYNPKNAGAGTDFVMDKPFIELAIKNPKSLTDRQLVGYRFGAHETWGIMSTGSAPTEADNTASPIKIYGPDNKFYGTGESAIDALWRDVRQAEGNNATGFEVFKEYVNSSVERGQTGVNSISGRLPVQLNNLNVEARVYAALGPLIDVHAKTAIVSGSLKRDNLATKLAAGTAPTESDFGRDTVDPAFLLGSALDNEKYSTGYLRNTYLGDRDTNYDPSIHGKYVANDVRQGRAPEFKRANRAVLDNMIVTVHDTLASIGAGDRLNTQDISAKAFHLLQYGTDLNGDYKYQPGEGAKHFAFSYQSLDGLQWITTNKRFGDQYDKLGNVVPGTEKQINGGGYDWLSTRAGWWLESPMARVENGYVPQGQAVTYGIPSADTTIQLKSLDLGARPIDNCYGSLNFC